MQTLFNWLNIVVVHNKTVQLSQSPPTTKVKYGCRRMAAMAEVPDVRAGGGSGSSRRAPTVIPGAMALAAVAHLLSPPDGALRPGRSLPHRTHPPGLGKAIA